MIICLVLGEPGRSRNMQRGWKTHASTEALVLLLELCDSALKKSKLGFAAVSRVLCGDAVTVSTGLLALLWGLFSAGALAGGARLLV